MPGRVESSGLLNQPPEFVNAAALVVLLLVAAGIVFAAFRARGPGDSQDQDEDDDLS